MKVAFRVDASEQIGIGHVMRCRALAAVLRERGADILFVTRHLPAGLRDLLGGEGFACLSLPHAAEALSSDGDEYATWLGVTEETDAAATLVALREHRPDVLVVDHYALSQRWEQIVRPGAKTLLAVDDIARGHMSDVLLDQNFSAAPEARYAGLVPAACRLLLGPRYVLLRPEYADAARNERDRGGPVRRVVVFFGGADTGNMTGKTLDALCDPRFGGLEVDVVVGPANPHADAIGAAAARRERTHVHKNRASLADLFSQADLAVGAGGTTTWERCCCGVPSLVVSIADNQKPASAALAEKGIIHYLGDQSDVTATRIGAGLDEMIAGAARRVEMSRKGRLLVDGRGAARVAEAIMPTPAEMLSVRPAASSDRTFLFHLANDPLVRAQSFNSDDIPWENHVAWFDAKIQDPNTRIFILTARGLAIGMIRFEIKGEFAVLNYALDAVGRGRKWGSALVERGLRALAARWAGDVHASVKNSNAASRLVFERLAFGIADGAPEGQLLFVLGARDLKTRFGS